jgi:general secretion pathway protein E
MDLDSETLAPADLDQRPAFVAAPHPDLLSGIMDEAIRRGATHVHLEPLGEGMQVRLRIAGQLVEVLRLPSRVALDLAGSGAEIAALGERTVLHMPPPEERSEELEALGMAPALVRMLAPVLARGGGLVLVAGLPGSGRTTTLRALLRQLDDGTRNLLAANDASQLRAVLRQDPDAILIDAIADRETAALAIQAAAAGHLVLAGVEASDAVSALAQLRALRVEPFQLASTLQAVLAQRLVRRLCRGCRKPVQAQGSVSALLGFDPGAVVYEAVGCDQCGDGFAGKIAVFEAIRADAPLRRLVNDGGDGAIIARHAFLNARNLGSAARALVREGTTTPEEAVRVSRG